MGNSKRKPVASKLSISRKMRNLRSKQLECVVAEVVATTSVVASPTDASLAPTVADIDDLLPVAASDVEAALPEVNLDFDSSGLDSNEVEMAVNVLVDDSRVRTIQRECDRSVDELRVRYDALLDAKDRQLEVLARVIEAKDRKFQSFCDKVALEMHFKSNKPSGKCGKGCCTQVRGEVPFSKLSESGKKGRVSFALRCLTRIVRSEDKEEVVSMMESISRRLNVRAKQGTLTGGEDYAMFSQLGVSRRQRQHLKSNLLRKNIDVLASNYASDKNRKENLVALEPFTKQTWFVPEQKLNSSGESAMKKFENEKGEVPCSFISNLRGYLAMRIGALMSSGKLPLHIDTLRIGLVCDKGGDETKLIGVIGEVSDPNSVYLAVMLLVYPGDDNHMNMSLSFPLIFSQINGFSSIVIDGRDIHIKWKMTADMKGLCALYGHSGASSTFFCLFCDARKATPTTKTKGVLSLSLRTLESISKDAALFDNLMSNGGNRAKISQRTLSVTAQPISNVPLIDVAPSPFHIPLGIFHSLFEMVELRLDVIDSGNILNVTKKGRRLANGTMSNKVKSAERLYADYQVEVDALRIVHEIHNSVSKSSIQPSTIDTVMMCDAKVCLLIDKRHEETGMSITETFTCGCTRKCHPFCELLISKCSIEKEREDGFVCRECSNTNETYLQQIARMIPYFESTLETARATSENAASLSEINRVGGEGRSKVNSIFREHNVVRDQTTKQFTGNAMKKVLSEKVLLKLGTVSNDVMVGKLIAMLKYLSAIVSLTKAEILSEEEIDKLEESITCLKTIYFEVVPRSDIQPKAHWLFQHVIPYVKREKTWGLISDQSIESIHHIWNDLICKFSNRVGYHVIMHRTFLEITSTIHGSGHQQHLRMDERNGNNDKTKVKLTEVPVEMSYAELKRQVKQFAHCSRVYRPRNKSLLYVSCSSQEEAAKLIAAIEEKKMMYGGVQVPVKAHLDDYQPRKLEKRQAQDPLPDLSRFVSNSGCKVVNINLNVGIFSSSNWGGRFRGRGGAHRGGARH